MMLAAFSAPLLPRAQSADVSIDFFYSNLSGGNWLETADYGYVWQPDVVSTNPNWRPYTDGYWSYTDYGWTWVSYEDFGWATYHYGRWARLSDYGWCWVPGYEWGPAWVSWRVGSEQIGWAPLPPAEPIYEGRPIHGQVDIMFDIGPSYYNFVDVNYIGEPVLLGHIYQPHQNYAFVNNSVNVTNITINNNSYYNYGPDFQALSLVSKSPIQKLKLEKQQFNAQGGMKAGMMTKVQGNKLVVAAPDKIQKPAQQIAPPKIKNKIGKAKLDKGWDGAGDQKTVADLKAKFKNEDNKKMPQFKGRGAAGAAVAASPAVAGPNGVAAQPSAAAVDANAQTAGGGGKGRKRGEKMDGPGKIESAPAGDATPAAAPGVDPAAAADAQRRGKGKRNRRNQLEAAPQPSVAPTGDPAAAPDMTAGGGGGGRGRRNRQQNADALQSAPDAPQRQATAPASTFESERKQRRNQRGDAPPANMGPTGAQGAQGAQGAVGAPPQGPQGLQGPQGVQGQEVPPPDRRGRKQRKGQDPLVSPAPTP